MSDMLAMIFAEYIMKGKQTFENVPNLLKPQVKQILEDQGLGHLAE
ncbi:hypothetical protein [Pueribacillus sp. YX66]